MTTAFLAFFCEGRSAVTNWIAFNDHVSGGVTHPWASAYAYTGGPLTNIFTGTALPVAVSISSPGTSGVNFAPGTNSPSGRWFGPFVDFQTGGGALYSDEVFQYTFTGLDVTKRYTFKTTTCRGNALYTNRWTVATLGGAVAFSSAHVPAWGSTTDYGVLTTSEVAQLSPNQAAFNSGNNLAGAMVCWTDIQPGTNGTFQVLFSQYTNTVPGGSAGGASSGYGPSAFSLEEILTILDPPGISTSPQSQVVLVGSNATLSVTASGTEPLSYQWYYNGGTLISNAIGPALVFTNIQAGHAGNYHVVVQNSVGQATSAVATLTVWAPSPIISLQPQSQSVFAGSLVTLNAGATGAPPIACQWQLNGSTILGATNATLQITKVQSAHAGSYQFLACNPYGCATSAVASITILSRPAAGTLRWTFLTGRSTENYPAIGPDNTVYIGVIGTPGIFYALDGYTGQKMWAVTNETASLTGVPTVFNGLIYTFSSGWVRTLRSDTGALVWSFNSGQTLGFGNGFSLDANGINVFAVAHNRSLYALNALTGSNLWQFPIAGEAGGGTAVGGDGNVYFGIKGNTFYSLDGQTGQKRWQNSSLGERVKSGPAFSAQGTVLFTSFDGKLYCHDMATGSNVWTFATPSLQWIWSTPVIDAEGIVYFGSVDKKFYAVDGVTGQKKWEYTAPSQIRSSPVLGSNGELYFGCDSKIIALVRTNGALAWSYPVSLAQNAAPALGDDGTLYVGTSDGKFLAIWTDSTNGLAVAPWPKYGRNKENTGNYDPQWMVRPGMPPGLYGQPKGVTRLVGETATLGVLAYGAAPFSYLWRLNGVMLTVTTSDTLTLTNLQAAQAGNYQVVVSNAFGAVTSQVATVGVVVPPSITLQPQSQSVFAGSLVTLNAGVTGAPPIACQWQLNGTDLPGATNTALQLTNVQAAAFGDYRLAACNAYGCATSAVAVISQRTRPAAGTLRWSFNTGRSMESFPAIDANNKVYMGTVGSPGMILYALDGYTGQQAWAVTNSGGVYRTSPAIANGIVYTGCAGGYMQAYRADNGDLVWSYNTSQTLGFPTGISLDAAGTTVYAVAHNRSLYAWNALTGSNHWQYAISGEGGCGAAISADGNVYFGIKANTFYSINGQNGQKRWQNNSLGERVYSGPAISARGTVLFTSFDGKLYCHDMATGSNVWTFATPSLQWIWSSPAIDADGTVYFGGYDKKFYAIDGATGQKKWEYTAPSSIRSSPVLGSNGELYFGCDSKIIALVRTNGAFVWSYPVSLAQQASPALGNDGTLYIGTSDGKFLAIWTDSINGLAVAPWPKYGRNQENTGNYDPNWMATAETLPRFFQQPMSAECAVGRDVTFNVSAYGAPPLGYQWFFNGLPLTNATNTSLTLTNLQLLHAGNYQAVITNLFGAATSQVAALTINQMAPVITLMPQSQSVMAGAPLTLLANASGALPLAWQWFFNTTNPVPGGTNAELVVAGVQAAHAGAYFAIASNSFGTATSGVALISVVATAPGLVAYYPLDNSANDSSGNGRHGTTTATTGAKDRFGTPGNALYFNGSAYVSVNGFTWPNLTNFTVSLWIRPLLNDSPFRDFISKGDQFAIRSWGSGLFAYGTFNGAGKYAFASTYPLLDRYNFIVVTYDNDRFKIYVNGTLFGNAAVTGPMTENQLPLVFGAKAGSLTSETYIGGLDDVRIYDRALPASEVQALLESGLYRFQLPQITAQPQNQVATEGGTANFSVSATGLQPMTYQWQKDGVPLANATNAALNIASVQAAQVGAYSVILSNLDGRTISSAANLTVQYTNNAQASTLYTLNIYAQIDGVSELYIRPDSIEWNHVSWTKPGKHTTPEDPTTINGYAWYPQWPSTGTSTAERSYPLTNINVCFYEQVTLTPQSARGTVGITSQPAASNSYTTILRFDDTSVMSHGYYQVTLQGLGPGSGIVSNLPPTITGQPASLFALPGSTVSFAVTATGTAPLAFQWYHGAAVLAAATNAALIVTNVQPLQAGDYRVVVSNSYGVVTSSVARLAFSQLNAAATYLLDGDAQDSSGQGHHGAVNGAAFVTDRFGTNHGACRFSGNNSWISIPYHADFDIPADGQFTISLWAQPDVVAGKLQAIFVKGGTSWDYGIYLGSNGRFSAGRDYRTEVQAVSLAASNAWHHVAATYSNRSWSIYVNGLLEAQAIGGADVLTSTRGCAIGRKGEAGWDYYSGTVDEVLFYNRCLSTTEILALATNVFTGLTITRQPQSAVVPQGSSVNFIVGASGSAPLAYQWLREGIPLAGATNSSHLFGNVQTNDGGRYSVVVSNVSTVITSAVGLLTVITPPQVALTVPTNGAAFVVPAAVPLSATIQSDWPVERLDFYAGSNLIATLAGPPYTLTWSNAVVGSYTLTALAIGQGGLAATSAPILIQVVVGNTNIPVINLASDIYRVSEAAGTVAITVRKSGGSPALVDYFTSSGSATTWGGDFLSRSGTLSFAAGETSKTVVIPIINDQIYEQPESFSFILMDSGGAVALGSPEYATVMIEDDDGSVATSSLTNIRYPQAAPAGSGSLRVVIEPAAAAGQWRFPWELIWHDSGQTVTGLIPDNYDIEFKPAGGYLQPPTMTLAVAANTATSVTNYYIQTAVVQSGGLGVAIRPSSLEGVTRWRRQGETQWHASGEAISDLNVGAYLVEFNVISGWVAPQTRTVTVVAGQMALLEATYLLAEDWPAIPPEVLTFPEVVNTNSGMPYCFTGQIRSDTGYGSGFVVKDRVVLTAGHVVFNDAALSFVSEVYWFFQQHLGFHAPKPLRARGWHVFSGYAARRAADNSPGLSSPESQNLDAAALFFNSAAGRNGFGGYLSSDDSESSWLTVDRPKMLGGYPMENVSDVARGKMHATPVMSLPFVRVLDKVFATSYIKSFPGNSGGPLCVQYTNSIFYPAAIYLGGSGNSVVRAIDSGVVDLINRAEQSANSGQNYTGGGVVLLTPGGGGGLFTPGYLQVVLGPAAAVNAGAGWRLVGHPLPDYYSNNSALYGLLAGGYTVEFKSIPGFQAPSNRLVQIISGQTAVIGGEYLVLGPGMVAPLRSTNGVFAFGLTGQPGKVYVMEASTNLGQTNWTIIATNTMGPGGVWQFTDPASTNLSSRYYRAREK